MILRTVVLIALIWGSLAGAETLYGPVTHVRDGDTIEVNGTPVRLRGVNCEEWDKPRGRQATEVMLQLTRGQNADCQLNGERNGDRVIGWCSVNGVDLGYTLISEGNCARCARYDPERNYVGAQRIAGPWRGRVPRYCK